MTNEPDAVASDPVREDWWPLEWGPSGHYQNVLRSPSMAASPTKHPLIARIVRGKTHTYFDEMVDRPVNAAAYTAVNPLFISSYYTVLMIDETDDLSIRAALLTLADPTLYPRSNPNGPKRPKAIERDLYPQRRSDAG